MKQLIQNFKTGELKLEKVPIPALKDGFVLVNNRFSLISPGTESATVNIGKASLLGKAKKRQDLVKQVLQNVKKEGLMATLQKVKTKLDTPKPLGYSSCGVVIESKDFEGKFRTGDRVACAGQDYACHSEIISVPQNLVVKIPEGVSFKEAAFTTIGAIALQGVRQADVKIGEKICVIGLGLIGQISFQILRANGCSVFGIDISDFAIEMAKKLDIDFAANRRDKDLYKYVDSFTKGYGFDKVIIAASTSDNDPIVLSTEILRKKGLTVVVGNVEMDIPREPHFYKKELELKIATSYGPGRYDSLYEEAGVDYPYAYVRFSENRNMETFLELLSRGAVGVKSLITHIFNFEKALEAYDLVLGKKKEDFIGILLKYKQPEKKGLLSKVAVGTKPLKDINVGFIGAGSFAQGYLLPHLKKMDVSLDTVVTTKGINAKNVVKKFGFNFASTNSEDIIENEKINTVFIASRHNTHSKYVCEVLKNKKNVFVEKPLCLNIDELKEIVSVYKGESKLMVGFNRRFTSISCLIKKELDNLNIPIIMNFRINAGYIPNEHWVQNLDIGGGRIVGEICHFIDLMIYFSNAKPKGVFASSIKIDSNKWRKDDNLVINIEFENGSLGNIVYTAMGNERMEKERIEIFAGGNTYVIDDFKKGLFYNGCRLRRIKNKGKGHKEEIRIFIDAIKQGKGNPIDFESLVLTTLTTFKVIGSLKSSAPEKIDISELY